MPTLCGATPVSKMYVGSTLVSAAYANNVSLLFSPLSLFAASEQGVWYDPSDWSTLFQDSAGTTPVNAVGQPVGLMLDKRLGLVRGPELCTDHTLSTPALWQFTGTAPLWAVSGGKAEITATSAGNRWLENGAPLVIGKTYEVTADVVVSAGSVAPDIGGSGLDVTTSGSKRWITTATTATLKFIGRSTFIGSIDNISVRELPGNHATQPTAINRPVLQINGNGKYYLAFNGTNSWMSTPAINFTATDKMTVVAGLRKMGTINNVALEIGSLGSVGSFAFFAPRAVGTYNFLATGAEGYASINTLGYPEPASGVLACSYDLSQANYATQIKPRINGVIPASMVNDDAASTGAGNFGNLPLNLGARSGSTFFFKGQLYGLVVRGALSTAPQIAAAESYMNVKTGAY